jgi:hypothetical protein
VIPYDNEDDTPAFSIEGQPRQLGELRTAERNSVGPDYFRLLRVRCMEGREFTPIGTPRTRRALRLSVKVWLAAIGREAARSAVV